MYYVNFGNYIVKWEYNSSTHVDNIPNFMYYVKIENYIVKWEFNSSTHVDNIPNFMYYVKFGNYIAKWEYNSSTHVDNIPSLSRCPKACIVVPNQVMGLAYHIAFGLFFFFG
jgi:hypothetical protein